MKATILCGFFLCQLTFSFAQTSAIAKMVDSLKYLKADTLDCKADLFWRIVAKGEKVIPFLINKLTDTTPTNVRFRCKNDRLNVAEIAQLALKNIAEFPDGPVSAILFDEIDVKGCSDFYEFFYLNSDKRRYQDSVRAWYGREKPEYKLVIIPKKERNACELKYGITNYLKLKD